MTSANWIALASYLSCMASFSWAMQRFFVRTSQHRPAGQRAVLYLGTVFALVQALAMLSQSMGGGLAFLVALLLWAVSLSIFWSAIRANRAHPLSWAFEREEPIHLVASGPYRWVRHPFYLSYMLCWLAPPIATANLWLLIPLVAMFPLYWRAALAEENAFLQSPLGSRYREYQWNTGRFWPRLFRG